MSSNDDQTPPRSMTNFLRDELDHYLAEDEIVADMEWPFAAVGELQDYLTIREKYPDEDFPAYHLVYDPFEWIMHLDDVSEIGVPARTFYRAFCGDAKAMDEASLIILKEMDRFQKTQDKTHPVRTGKQPSDATVNFLVAGMHEVCASRGVVPPGSLVYLTSLRLCGENPKAKQTGAYYRQAYAAHNVLFPFNPMGTKSETEPPTSLTGLARALGVPTSTVSRSKDKRQRAWELWAVAESPPADWLDPPIPYDQKKGRHL